MLKTRAVTAFIFVPVFLFFVYLGNFWYALFLLAASLIGLQEYNRLAAKGGWNPVGLPGYLFVLLAIFTVLVDGFLVALLWLVIGAAYSLFPVFLPERVSFWDSLLSFWGLLYTGGLFSFLLAIRLLPEGMNLTLFLLVVIWIADVVAYLVGSAVGKRPLASQISPKKTVEGTLGGLLGGVGTAALLSWFLPVTYIPFPVALGMGLAVGITGLLGDLVQSALKRSVDAKDSGDLLPGHGGVLDRFDSLLFSAPFFYLWVYFILIRL